MQSADLVHQGVVNRQAARGIDQQNIKKVFFGVVERSQRNVQRLLIGRAREPFGPGLRGHGFELLDRGRSVHVP